LTEDDLGEVMWSIRGRVRRWMEGEVRRWGWRLIGGRGKGRCNYEIMRKGRRRVCIVSEKRAGFFFY